MTLLLRPLQTLISTFHIILLCQVSLALALPTNSNHFARGIDARDIATPDLSGSVGKIAGAAVALVLLSLGFGLGLASIAILGSTEWREFRDRKKPKVPSEDGNEVTPKQEGDESGVNRSETGLSDSTVDDKEKQLEAGSGAPERRTRLTLKTFMPIDFNDLRPGWLGDTSRK